MTHCYSFFLGQTGNNYNAIIYNYYNMQIFIGCELTMLKCSINEKMQKYISFCML